MTELTISPAPTPNPNARKFTLNRAVGATMLNLGSAEEAAMHPLAAALFALDGVTNVFLTADFITVNKMPESEWAALEADIIGIIHAHYEAGV